MKKLQLTLIFGLLLSLVIYTIYNRLSEEFNYRYEHGSRYQFYSVEDPPERIYFAGEEMPLENEAVAKKFERELQIQTYWNASRLLLFKRAKYWLPQIEPILKQYGIPKDFKYMAVVESMLTNVESPRRAAGFWQIMAGTGESYGLEINDEVDERYHPIKATHVACKYLKESYERFGNWTSVAASYNAGMSAISKALRRQNQDSYYDLRLNKQTADYVFRIVALKQLLEHPREYGYKLTGNNPYKIALKKVKVTESIPDLEAFAASHGITLETLKQHNAWLLKNTLTIKSPEQSYVLLIPKQREILIADEQKASTELAATDTLQKIKPDSIVSSRK